MKKALLRLGLIIVIIVTSACPGNKPPQHTVLKKYIVHPETLHKTLFFTGTLEPLKEQPLTCPFDAIIEAMPHGYGQFVQQGETVFTLNSAELEKQYNETLTEYLKAKDNYSVANAKFVGTEDLWQAGLMAKNNYLSEKSSLNTSRISLMQATRKLTETLEKMGNVFDADLAHLSFAEFDKVRLALMGNHNLIPLNAPSNGVLLYPPKVNDDKSERMRVGSTVKAGQVLGLIGDLSGVRIEINVPEVDIDKIKIGMPATIRGVAFAKHDLKGTLVSLNAQASTTNSGALPSFTALVEVKNLTPTQQALIKVGMSAAIELTVKSTDKLLVPIMAVRQKRNVSIVQLIDSKDKIHEQVVTTGAAYVDKVVIDTGLKQGDVIVYDE